MRDVYLILVSSFALQLADKFQVDEMTKRCARSMSRTTHHWSDRLVCEILAFGRREGGEGMAKKKKKWGRNKGHKDKVGGICMLVRRATQILLSRFGNMEEHATFMKPDFLNLPASALQILLAR